MDFGVPIEVPESCEVGVLPPVRESVLMAGLEVFINSAAMRTLVGTRVSRIAPLFDPMSPLWLADGEMPGLSDDEIQGDGNGLSGETVDVEVERDAMPARALRLGAIRRASGEAVLRNSDGLLARGGLATFNPSGRSARATRGLDGPEETGVISLLLFDTMEAELDDSHCPLQPRPRVFVSVLTFSRTGMVPEDRLRGCSGTGSSSGLPKAKGLDVADAADPDSV